MKALLIVEDDLDLQVLIETIFSVDPRFALAGMADTAGGGVELARTAQPELIVLDDRLNGAVRGLDAVTEFRAVAPQAKIILFTAYADVRARVDHDPTVDALLLKTDSGQLLPLAQRLTNMLSLA